MEAHNKDEMAALQNQVKAVNAEVQNVVAALAAARNDLQSLVTRIVSLKKCVLK